MADVQKSLSSDQQVRLMIWAVPRSLSTVLSKCLSFVDNSKVFVEAYETALTMGPDRELPKPAHNIAYIEERMAVVKETFKMSEKSTGIDVSQFSFKWVKEQLEGSHVGKKLIFCKDMAYIVTDRLEFLPKGYRHLFLIRHPLKVFPSWKKSYQAFLKAPHEAFRLDDLPPTLFPKCFGFQEISELFDHVKEAHDQEAIIIDADDLLQDPKGILSALFTTIGLPFEEKILQWEAGDGITEHWVISKQYLQGITLGQFYKNAMGSTCFLKPRALPDRSSLSPEILRYVEASMPYYEKMYAKRLTVQ